MTQYALCAQCGDNKKRVAVKWQLPFSVSCLRIAAAGEILAPPIPTPSPPHPLHARKTCRSYNLILIRGREGREGGGENRAERRRVNRGGKQNRKGTRVTEREREPARHPRWFLSAPSPPSPSPSPSYRGFFSPSPPSEREIAPDLVSARKKI
jgi:hypothetical protein